jgi:tetratricopeptide (TPR) repeat protein
MARHRRRGRPAPEPGAPVAAAAPITRWVPALIVVAAVLAFGASLRAPFFLDDGEAIERNPHIRSLWPLADALASPPQSAVSGRPLVSLSLALNYAIGGLTATGYHLWNLAVHVACALLLFGIARRTLRRSALAAAADHLALAIALLWAVHPLHTEVIAYVVTRTESTMGLCYLLTLYGTVRGIDAPQPRGWLALAIVAGLAGAAAKESIVTAPLMVLLYDAVFGAGSLREAVRRRGAFHAAMLVSWLLLAALHWDGPRSRSAGWAAGMSSWDYLLTQAPIIAEYLRLAVWPSPLVADYGLTVPVTLSAVWPWVVVVLVLLVATLWLWRRRPALAYVATWFWVTLAPSSSVVPIVTELGATRRMYLPLMAVVVLMVLAARWGATRVVPLLTGPAGAAALVAATALALVTVSASRAVDYQDPVRIWTTVLAARPHGRAHHNLGIALAAAHRDDEALAHYRTAAETLPEARYSLGYMLAARGDDRAAVTELREFLARTPDDASAPLAHRLLGLVLTRQGDAAGAVAAYEQAVGQRPNDEVARRGLAEALTSLGATLAADGRSVAAAEAFARGAVVAPEAPGAHLNHGTMLMQLGRSAEAEAAFRRGLSVAPDHAPLRNALAAALATRGAAEEAAAEFRRVLAADPGNAEARAGLRVLERPRRPAARP